MKIRIGFINSDKIILIKEIDPETFEVSQTKKELQSLPDENLNLLIISERGRENLQDSLIQNENKFYPVMHAELSKLNLNELDNLDAKAIFLEFKELRQKWLAANNLKEIENLYQTTLYFKNLWLNDRNNFFEELWFFLKRNIAPYSLSLYFNDLTEDEKNKEKGKLSLSLSYVEGERVPQVFTGGERESLLMKHYENDFKNSFELTDYNKDKKQLVATAKINLSPILILAKVEDISKLQKALLSSIIQGLQKE